MSNELINWPGQCITRHNSRMVQYGRTVEDQLSPLLTCTGGTIWPQEPSNKCTNNVSRSYNIHWVSIIRCSPHLIDIFSLAAFLRSPSPIYSYDSIGGSMSLKQCSVCQCKKHRDTTSATNRSLDVFQPEYYTDHMSRSYNIPWVSIPTPYRLVALNLYLFIGSFISDPSSIYMTPEAVWVSNYCTISIESPSILKILTEKNTNGMHLPKYGRTFEMSINFSPLLVLMVDSYHRSWAISRQIMCRGVTTYTECRLV